MLKPRKRSIYAVCACVVCHRRVYGQIIPQVHQGAWVGSLSVCLQCVTLHGQNALKGLVSQWLELELSSGSRPTGVLLEESTNARAEGPDAGTN